MSLNSLKVILESGKVIYHTVPNDILIVRQLLQKLQTLQHKEFSLFMDSKSLQPHDKIQIMDYQSQYIMAIESPNKEKQISIMNNFTDQREAFDYLRQLGISQVDLTSANIDPRDKLGFIKNYLFNAKMKREFQYSARQEVPCKLSEEDKQRVVEEFVESQVLEKTKAQFQDIKEENADVIYNSVESLIEKSMNMQ